ncbi:DUF1523 family protein [Tropicimonas sp. S265A]|uniref:DUF1523 family protein n=1 Tax=Tropicimonas sp. S265A TaxID=3415134 RepID=UPI003C79F19A
MTYLRWGFKLVLILLIGGFLHYVLPSHDVVRIVDAYERRVDFTANNRIFWSRPDSGAPDVDSRDVRFIDAVKTNGREIVYRNEDTSWGWPFYFKFDSSDLNARAKDLVSPSSDPQWVVIRNYGWRSNFFSIFPNATSLRVVDTPDPTIIPWFNIAFFAVLALIALRIWRWWSRFEEDRIEPVMDEIAISWGRENVRPNTFLGRIGRALDWVRGKKSA